MSDEHACSHSTLGYLRDLTGVTMPSSSNMLSETSAVNFFGCFNFVFLLDENGVEHDGPLWSRKPVKWANHNLL